MNTHNTSGGVRGAVCVSRQGTMRPTSLPSGIGAAAGSVATSPVSGPPSGGRICRAWSYARHEELAGWADSDHAAERERGLQE